MANNYLYNFYIKIFRFIKKKLNKTSFTYNYAKVIFLLLYK